MLLLSMSSCGKVWSVDRWLAVRRGQTWSETGPAWPRRLIQILIGVIYLAAAATKLHTPTFFTGDQLRFWLLTNVNMDNPFGEYLSQYPGMILVMVYVTIFWEIVFLFTCWKGVGRAINLSLGLVFHVMTIFTLGLVMGLSIQDTTLGTTVGNLGMTETVFPKPVFAGDTIRAETRIVEKRESKSRPTQGILTFEHIGLNQRDEIVCKTLRQALMMKLPA